MVLRNVAKTFSLEQQRLEINLIAADLHSLSQVSETDPIFGAAPAASITAQQITNWDLAYTWGDHGAVGYLTSFTETDPVFIASPAGSITQQHITNWDSAYGWGNHANAGYLTSNAIAVADIAPASPTSGDLWWNSISGVLKIYYQDVDTSQWVDASPTASSAQGAKVITSDLPPMNPVQGDLWWDSSDGSLKIYFSDGDSNQWVDASHASPGAIISGGGASVTTSDVPPSNAADGDLWWKSDVGVLKIYYDDGNTQQWVDASPSGSGGGGGSSYTNSDVDAHLNRSTATTGQVLSWNGSDYDWVAQSGGGGGSGISLTDLSVTQNSAGTAALTYNNTNGVFSYTPPDLSGYLTAETDPLFNASAASGIAASDITNWDAAFSWGNHANAGYLTSNAIVVADVAPTSPASGDLWWHSGSGRLKIYYQDVDTTQWVDASPPLASNAIQVQSDWGETDSNNVAFIQNKPTIPAAQVNSDWNAASGVEQILNKPTLFDGDYNNLTNKPTLFDGDYNNLTNKPTIPSNTGIVSVKDYGAVGNGSDDDTAAIQSALNSNHKAIYFPTGDYVITAPLTSSLDGRKICGEGTITTTATALSNAGSSILLKAFVFEKGSYGNSEYVDFSLDCDGNNLIEIFAQFKQCLDPHIHHCRVRNLESPVYPTGGKAIAFELFNEGTDAVDTGAKITDNYITNLIAHNDDGGVIGRGMARGIAFDTDRTLNKPILIADNVIDTVAGNEGDAISVMSKDGSVAETYYNANVFITGNHIKDFNRRGCKIKFNSAVISNNTFYNTWTSSPVNDQGVSVVQGVVDLDKGSDHIVTGNKFINTEYMGQIKIVAAGSERIDNCVIKDNVFTRIGFQTTSTLIYVSTSISTDAAQQGVNLTIKDNSFDVPGYTGTCIRVNRTTNVIVTDNTGIFSNTNTIGVSFGACHNVISNNNNFLNPNGSINNVGTLSELDNVNVTNATSGQVLQYDGSNWNNSPGLNVNITNPTSGQVLKYDGTNWVNDTDAT